MTGERLACVDLPALPLQLVLRSHPEWREDPVVVVEDDRPLARVLWANRNASSRRILRGMRFAEAQSLVARLRGVVVAAREVDEALDVVLTALLGFSPRVEPSPSWPGVFWLDPNGLEKLHGNLGRWASVVHRRLGELGFVAAVVVGTKRYGAFALARTRTGPHVFEDPAAEAREASRVPLSSLDLSSRLLEEMEVLSVTTLGDFLALPAEGLAVRYGEEARALHELASGSAWTPLMPVVVPEPVRGGIEVDPPDDDATRLLFGIKHVLHGALDRVAARSEGATAIVITFSLDHDTPRRERIEAAAPTLDVLKLSDLVRLRLSSITFPAPVEHVTVEVESVPLQAGQLELFLESRKRDLAAAAGALARVRAAFGDSSVARARLVEACLPEARYRWEPLPELREARPSPAGESLPPLVRNVLETPLALPDRPRHETERWLGRRGAVQAMFGPGRVRHGWWGKPVERDYYYLETETGEILWVYFDRIERKWFLHGTVD
jgi:protein ImuB